MLPGISTYPRSSQRLLLNIPRLSKDKAGNEVLLSCVQLHHIERECRNHSRQTESCVGLRGSVEAYNHKDGQSALFRPNPD